MGAVSRKRKDKTTQDYQRLNSRPPKKKKQKGGGGDGRLQKRKKKKKKKEKGNHRRKPAVKRGGNRKVKISRKRLQKTLPSLLCMTPQFNSNRGQRQALIKKMRPCDKECLTSCCQNFLQGKYPVNAKELAKLRRNRKVIYEMADDNISLPRSQKLLNQRGGIIGAILPLIAKIVLPRLLGF